MADKKSIEITGSNLLVVDERDNVPIVDSFVKKNKIGRGSGEARLYVGSQSKDDFDSFFGEYPARGLFLKKDLADYLNDAKFEYEEQEQKYRADISADWQKYYTELGTLSESEYFTFESAIGDKDNFRYYIRSQDAIFRNYFRSIMLPIISRVSILKLRDSGDNILFLFRPSLDYSFNPYYHPAKQEQVAEAIEKSPLRPEKKLQLVEARIGQGTYRTSLLEESAECVITRVSDERVLIASHIKPWSVSSNAEKIDHQNGLILTPTYDRLFDQGFITFENDGKILISPYISPLNVKKLNLIHGKKYVLPPGSGRLAYLDYHRKTIFKK